ncbi:MAG TPA: hypothetical protein VHQ67_04780 [Nitrospiraceae bacterium]|nr:hypothetical protein [Nitrospiraceae bacterium]
MSRYALRLILVVLFWYCAGAVFAQVMGEEAEMARLQNRAEEAIANDDPDGAAMNMGKAALMASQLAKRQANSGQSQWLRGTEAFFRAQEQAYRALALFQRAGGQTPASSGVCGSMRLAKEHLDKSIALMVDAAPRDGHIQAGTAEWIKTLEGMNADFQCR